MRRFYRSATLTGIVWLIARLLLAYEWIPSGWEKLFGPGSSAWVGAEAGTAVTGFLNRALTLATGEHPAVSQWYAWAIQNLLLPNATVFSYLVAVGEVLVGIAILFGMFTRFATSMALIMNMSFFYAGTVSSLPYVLPLEIAIVLIGVYAGYIGIDGMVLARFSNWFKSPADDERAHGAARVWEIIIPIIIVIWILYLLLTIVWG
ncbi:MAG: DoxX family protein [Anaerolineae bacterium]